MQNIFKFNFYRRSPKLLLTLTLSIVLALLPLVTPALASGTAEPTSHDIRPRYGVRDIGWLSDYHSGLRNTPGDTRVYQMSGDKQGGAVLILGGTHPNEVASVLAAVLLVENAKVSAGTVFVIPHANNSASSYTDPRHDVPEWLEFETESGTRTFRYGARYTNPEHQEKDPKRFKHYPSGFEFKGKESRNLNRVHPGKKDGTLTQQISFALFQLVEKESVDVVIDMHEASPGWRLANSLICHPDALEIGSMAKMDMEMEGTDIKLEQSQPADKFHGLSHREFGDNTDAYAFLIESINPGQGDVSGDVKIINNPEHPLKDRVKFQLSTIQYILSSYNIMAADQAKKIEIQLNVDLANLKGSGLSRILR
ncbi:succinylglutamate desuccinylase/aspartoacylase family protein [Candidatus Bipolaricaulota bacterium]|nr:succinylglutamate desuccinylase/aspartoacylase family protein [Candidatus Bipolaricaulota bacterium]MBS3792581.1 succinylglutamate desuccinylase/aspartoacylase family protein [Candidatus Bipolaricaulota bacterium]